MLSIISRGIGVLDPAVRRRVPLMLAAVIGLSVLETVGISAVFPIILLLIDPSGFLDRPVVARIYAASGFSSPRDFALALVIAMIAALIFKNLASILLYRWQFKVLQRSVVEFSTRAFGTYLRMPYLTFLQRNTGFFLYTINSLGTIICSTFVYQLVLIVSEIITVSLLFCMLLYANPIAAVAAFAVLALTGAVIYLGTSRNLARIGDQNRAIAQRTNQLINETFGSFKELRVLGRGGRFLAIYASEIKQLADNQATFSLYNASARYLVEISMLLTIGVFIAVTVSNQSMASSIGLISLFGAASLRILPSIARLLGATQTLKTLESPIRLAEDEAANIARWRLEPENSIHAPTPGEGRVQTDVLLSGISFQYDGKQEPAIKNVSLEIPFGQSLGVVGASGSGKTTVADIILGLIVPERGTVLSGGRDIHDDLVAWRRSVAYVPQQIAFVSGTIRSNVAFGLRDDEIDDARVVEVLEIAQLSGLVKRLPQGIHSPIGEAGKLLSGGERQRLGIARALYQNASVLVLDEATSALDVETEDRLTTLLHELKGFCSTVIIAHRLKTIRECDRVALFSDGQLVAIGSFDELTATDSRFGRLVELSKLGVEGSFAEEGGVPASDTVLR
jgi:ABC-type multidrug transport system fused ATPase/permease subunit